MIVEPKSLAEQCMKQSKNLGKCKISDLLILCANMIEEQDEVITELRAEVSHLTQVVNSEFK
jgi:hypothetical protein